MDVRRGTGDRILLSACLAGALAAACAKPGPVSNDHAATGDCWACHGDRYEAVKDPDHAGLGFPHQCSGCHDTESWVATVPDAHRDTGAFPLLGRHHDTNCTTCHGTGTLGPLDPACAACHQDAYDDTTAPDHRASGYPTTCRDCHGFDGWTPAQGGPHGPTGSFPLSGKHATQTCNACHGNPPWGNLDPACAACHRRDYDGTTDPAHAAAGFPTTCADCHHGFDAWTPATAGPHGPGEAFPLTGGHAAPACKDCHEGTTFADVRRTCDGCHAGDYDATTNPGHGKLSLPRTCQTCHTIAGWKGATLGAYHKFPVTSGRHAGLACSACHPAAQPWAAYTCIACHTHNKADTDGHHGEVGGYVYESTACVRCHPQGVAGDGL